MPGSSAASRSRSGPSTKTSRDAIVRVGFGRARRTGKAETPQQPDGAANKREQGARGVDLPNVAELEPVGRPLRLGATGGLVVTSVTRTPAKTSSCTCAPSRIVTGACETPGWSIKSAPLDVTPTADAMSPRFVLKSTTWRPRSGVPAARSRTSG